MNQQEETRFKLYYVAFVFYAIAPICLLIFIVDMLTVGKTGVYFWALSLFSCFPSMLTGFILSLIGWTLSSKQKKKLNISTGKIATLLGGAGIFAGLLGWGLLYVVVG
ncbi:MULTISPECIES: hypothetical protein [unclassified Parabacteroides]|uniref:hypothetical protein n=1 Tax=unclassified Parabacteroides TaxID=2649774 RepID=UPI0024757450|nr:MULTISPECIES: hypothetical protein [unclassified Parabacteroides]